MITIGLALSFFIHHWTQLHKDIAPLCQLSDASIYFSGWW